MCSGRLAISFRVWVTRLDLDKACLLQIARGSTL